MMIITRSKSLWVSSILVTSLACSSGDVGPSIDAPPDDSALDALVEGDGDLQNESSSGDVSVGPPADANGEGASEVLVPLTPELCDDPSLMAALQPGMMSSPAPTYGTPNVEQILKMIQAPTEGPFYMVNLIKFREQALYPDGRETTLSGEEANLLYSPFEFIAAIGAKVVFGGPVSRELEGPEGAWDEVGIVEYPCPLAFFAMAAHPEFQARSVHKEAGVERSTVMVTYPSDLAAIVPAPDEFEASDADPSFERVQVVRYRAEALYGEDSAEPQRSGKAAMEMYDTLTAQVAEDVGMTPRARLIVDGVFVGDGRVWNEVIIDAIPSGTALSAFASDPEVVSAIFHREAAIDEVNSVGVTPLLETAFPGAVSGQ